MTQGAMLTPPEATTWSVDDILRRAQEGFLRVPAFQRSFRWDRNDILKFFDSIYRGYPIGDLLVWESEHTDGTTTEFGPIRYEPKPGRHFVIVDGQQRITSLVAVMGGGGNTDDLFRLFFDLESRTFVSLRKNQEPRQEWLPLQEAADTVRFLLWLQARSLTPKLVTAANQLVRSLRDYRVPVYIVRTDDEDRIREIFERLNNGGRKLEADEIFDALQGGRHGVDLAEISQRLHRDMNLGELPKSWILKAVGAILGLDVTKKLGESLRKKKAEEISRGLADTEQALRRVLQFLRDDAGLLHLQLLPYRFPIVPLTKFFHWISEPSPSSRHALAVWLWRGAWSERHARSDAPTIRAILSEISADETSTIANLLRSVPAGIDPFELRGHDFRSAGTKIACAALASLGPQNLESGERIDVAQTIEAAGASAFLRVLHHEGDGGTENRLLHPPAVAGSLREALVRAPESRLSGHCVSPSAREALKQGMTEDFLQIRREALQSLVRDFLAQRTSMPV